MVFPTMVLMGLKRMFRYPWGLLLSLVIDPIILILNIILFKAIFTLNQGRDVAGYTEAGLVWYFACSNFIWYWIYNFTDRSIGQRIISGDLTLDLLRPLSVFTLELSRAVSLRVSGIIFEFLPSLIIYSFIVIHPFMTVVTLFQFFVSATLSFFLFYAMNFLIGLAGNYIQSTTAISAIKHIIVAGLGGSFIPLEFFPDSLAVVLRELPFASLFYWPLRFFLGMGGNWTQFTLRTLVTIGWLLFFLCLDTVLWKRAIKRFSGAGG